MKNVTQKTHKQNETNREIFVVELDVGDRYRDVRIGTVDSKGQLLCQC